MDATYVVKKQIRGGTGKEVETVLQYLRSDKNYEGLSYKNKMEGIVGLIFHDFYSSHPIHFKSPLAGAFFVGGFVVKDLSKGNNATQYPSQS